MLWFISFIISVLILGTLLFFSYPQKKVRDSVTEYWDHYPWVNDGDERVKVPLWVVIVLATTCFIPVINIVVSVIMIVAYCMQLSGECSNNGWDRVATRMVLRAPHLMWFKWLNKKV